MKIQWRNPEELIPYDNNARVHTEDQVNQIAASINEFGFNQPVLLDGNNGIIAGHGRVQAAIALKLESIPTIDLSHLDEIAKRAYILADNKIALNSEWDIEKLGEELDALNADDVDLALLGFSPDDLERIADDRDLAAIRSMANDGDDSDDGDAKPSTLGDTESKTELFPLSLMLEHEQREVVFKALKKAKQIHNLETSSQSIWLICKEYINE